MLPLLDDFLLSLRVDNFSQETIYNYERDLAVFDDFISKELKFDDFNKINKKTIELYKAYLTSRDRKTAKNNAIQKYLAPGSVNRYLSSLRGYLKYLIEMDHLVPVPPELIKMSKTVKKKVMIPDMLEFIKIIESPSKLEKEATIAKRNRALLEVIFATGMRISEVVSLRLDKIDRSGRIFVLGKGKKERYVYLTPRAGKYLNEYLLVRKSDSPFVFVPLRGSNAQDANKKISTNYVQYKLKKYRQLLGISFPVSPHTLRHGFATFLAEKGANPAAIQILLGHESLDTTTRYVHASDRYAEKTHHKFHPLFE